MMKKIFLNPRRVNVGRVITENNALVYKSISKGAMWRTTQYGEKAVYRAVARVKPYKPIASGEYRSLWQAKRTKKGGIIGNPTLQAYFVEVGRRPGGKPPLNFDRILQWVIDKKLVQQAERALRKKKAADAKEEDTRNQKTSAEVQKEQKAAEAADRRVNPVTGGMGAADDAAAKLAERAAKAKLTRARNIRRKAVPIAWAVATKVARQGFRGKFVMKGVLPLLGKRLRKEVRKSIRDALAKAKSVP